MSRGKAEAGSFRFNICVIQAAKPAPATFLSRENEQFPFHRSRMLDDGRQPIEKSEKGRLSNC